MVIELTGIMWDGFAIVVRLKMITVMQVDVPIVHH
jgi:hypothetical protein